MVFQLPDVGFLLDLLEAEHIRIQVGDRGSDIRDAAPAHVVGETKGVEGNDPHVVSFHYSNYYLFYGDIQ